MRGAAIGTLFAEFTVCALQTIAVRKKLLILNYFKICILFIFNRLIICCHTHISDVVETSNIIKTETGATADSVDIDLESYVSMNFWGFLVQEGCAPAYLDVLEQELVDFFENTVPSNPLKAEYLLPIHIGGLLREGKVTVKVLSVTYKEDKETVVESFKKLIADGVYQEELYSDLKWKR